MKLARQHTKPTTIETLRKEMDQFFDDLIPFSWKRENGGNLMDALSPNADISEDEKKFIVKMDMPGMTKDNISVSFDENRLIVSGERTEEEEEKEKNFIRKERYQGSFYRSFTIPKGVKEDEIEAKFKEGVLTINLPKMETSKPTTVKVE